MEPTTYPATARPTVNMALRRYRVLRDPAVHDVPVQVVEERADVGRAIGLVVQEVRVLVHVERDERRRIPYRERVLRVADVVEEPALVPVVRRPRPAPRRHAGRPEVGAPGVDRAEVALDERREGAGRIAAAAAEVREVQLVVLDAADGEGEVDLERAQVGIDLVRSRRIRVGKTGEDLVPLVHVSDVELVVRLDRGARDPRELVDLRAQRAGRDLLELVGERGHGGGAYPPRRDDKTVERSPGTWRSNSLTCPTDTTHSSRTSTRRRCGSTTTCITRPTSTTRTPRSTGPSGPASRSSRSSATSRSFRRRRGRPFATTPEGTRTIPCSGRSCRRTAAGRRGATWAPRSTTAASSASAAAGRGWSGTARASPSTRRRIRTPRSCRATCRCSASTSGSMPTTSSTRTSARRTSRPGGTSSTGPRWSAGTARRAASARLAASANRPGQRWTKIVRL